MASGNGYWGDVASGYGDWDEVESGSGHWGEVSGSGNHLISTKIINSTINHLRGLYIDLQMTDVFFTEPRHSTGSIFDLDFCRISITNSEFRDIYIDGNDDEDDDAEDAVFHVYNSQLEIQQTIFSSNSAYSSIIFGVLSNISIISSHFDQNSASYGGCIQARESCVSVTNSNFSMNQAFWSGGAIRVYSSVLMIDNCIFLENSAICTEDVTIDEEIALGFYTLAQYQNDTKGIVSFFSNKLSKEAILEEQMIVSYGCNGGAIDAYKNVTITILNSLFRGNSAPNGAGGGLSMLLDSELTIVSSVFENNSAGGKGAAVNAGHLVKVDIDSSVFTNNLALKDGALYLKSFAYFKITNSSFDSNAVSPVEGFGGAISAVHKIILEIDSSSFTRNIASQGGGITASQEGHITIRNASFYNNSASGNVMHDPVLKEFNGGAIWISGHVKMHIVCSSFEHNSAPDGAAIAAQYNIDMTLTEVNISDNNAHRRGMIGVTINVYIFMKNCTFQNNQALDTSAIFISDNSTLFAVDTQFVNNTAEGSGEIVAYRSGHIQLIECHFSGGKGPYFSLSENTQMAVRLCTMKGSSFSAITVHSSKLMLENCVISDNSGHFLANVVENSELNIQNCTIISNSFSPSEMFSISESNFQLEDTGLVHNTAKQIARLNSANFTAKSCHFLSNHGSGNGGIISSTLSNIFIIETTVQDNSAAGWGGFVHCDSGNITIYNSSFGNNSAKGGCGGVISLYSNGYTSISIMDTNFSQNSAKRDGGVIYTTCVTGTCLTDISLDSCDFIENVGKYDSGLYLSLYSSFRTARCNFYHGTVIAKSDTQHNYMYYIFFDIILMSLKYFAYETTFRTGDVVINSSDPDFLQKAVSSDVIRIYKNPEQNFIFEETPYAAGDRNTINTLFMIMHSVDIFIMCMKVEGHAEIYIL